MRKQIFSIAVAAAFAIPSLANAYVEVQTVEEDKVLVSFDVSQTASEEGRADLERTIRAAAKRVCGPMDTRSAGSLAAATDNKACFRNAVARAMRTVESGTSNIAAVTSN